MKKIERFEAIRGFVAVYVVFHHLYLFSFSDIRLQLFDIDFTKVLHLLHYGFRAVMIFFILSGFVIQLSYYKSKDKSFKLFFYKRYSRIFIPLFLVFISTALLQLYQSGGLSVYSPSILLGNLLMLQEASVFPNIPTLFENFPLWSLSHEWWYYMLFIAMSVYGIRKNKMSYVVYSLTLLSAITIFIYPTLFHHWFLYMVAWWFGRELALLYIEKKDISFKNLSAPIIVTLLAYFILEGGILLNDQGLIQVNFRPVNNAKCVLDMLIVMVGGLIWYKLKWVLFKYTVRPFIIFADISYGIYISHFFLIIQANYLDEIIPNLYIRLGVYIIVCFAFAYLIERIIYPRVNNLLFAKLFPNKIRAITKP